MNTFVQFCTYQYYLGVVKLTRSIINLLTPPFSNKCNIKINDSSGVGTVTCLDYIYNGVDVFLFRFLALVPLVVKLSYSRKICINNITRQRLSVGS